MKKIRYFIEALLLLIITVFFKILPLDIASAIGGFIGRTIGPILGASKKAKHNITLAFPQKTEQEKNNIIKGMWDNLGRVIAEYPHLQKIAQERIEFNGADIVQKLAQNNPSAIIFGAHLGNWEIASLKARDMGLNFQFIYRAPNNPWSDAILKKCRSPDGTMEGFPKSQKSMRQIMLSLSKGTHIGILIDQKYNEGSLVPFFGHNAKTSDAFITMGKKFSIPIHPIRVERLKGAYFKVTLLPEFKTTNDAHQEINTHDLLIQAHHMLESWITERPEQWLWLHRRWPQNV